MANDNITKELELAGIPTTEDNISAIQTMLKTNGRATVKSAVKRLADAYQTQSKQTQKAGGEIKDKLAQVAGKLKTNIKSQVVSSAISGALEDFRRGDFGDLSQMSLDDLDSAIDAEYSLLSVEDLDPKYLLPSSNSTNLLSGGMRSLTGAVESEG